MLSIGDATPRKMNNQQALSLGDVTHLKPVGDDGLPDNNLRK
jgi:hypothetical protein